MQTLLDIQKQTGVIAKELSDLPCLPMETSHIWRWFTDLNKRRQSSMSIAPLAWSDIDGYFRRRRIDPMPWEMDAIDRLEDCYLAAMDAKNDKPVTGLGLKNLTQQSQ